MPRFYIPQTFVPDQEIGLPENVCRHLHVLRLQAGTPVILFDGAGRAAEAVLLEVGRRQAAARIDRLLEQSCESLLSVTLVQAVSASEKMDFTVQKSTELGVRRIIPVLSERSNVRLQGERAERKVRRWQDIVISACEQCGRNRLPEVAPIASLPQVLAGLAGAAGRRLLLSPYGSSSLSRLPAAKDIVLLVGPEGGLTAAEEDLAHRHGFQSVRLGARVLRTETAALAALAAMQALWGDF